jgi:hypothetical protein
MVFGTVILRIERDAAGGNRAKIWPIESYPLKWRVVPAAFGILLAAVWLGISTVACLTAQ